MTFRCHITLPEKALEAWNLLKSKQVCSMISAQNMDAMLWMTNDEWYVIDHERQRFVLTDKAPAEARRSFEKYKMINDLPWDDTD